MLQFQDKVALITGSGTGIGMTVAKKFVENGASVIILGRRKEPLESTSTMLQEIIDQKQTNGFVKIFSGVDVSDEKAITEMFDTLQSENINVDVVVNNAGVSGPVTCFAHAPLDDFRSTVDIHLTGTFWTSVQALKVMKEGGKIITISTFFAEERPLEQRPYRFRGPYTASQGAKNRLVEAMSWELTEKGIVSIGTNPGPVHSDRIYKTVYPKAASEFLRVSGFEELSPSEVEAANKEIVGLLGEDDQTIKDGIKSTAEKIGKSETVLTNLLNKVQYIAEKIQKNTSTMIPDQQFLSQDQVATTVLTLADDEQSKILNGKIIPGDRVFYPVKSHIRSSVPKIEKNNFEGITCVITNDDSDDALQKTTKLKSILEERGAKIVGNESESNALFIHITGDVPEFSKLTELTRNEWDGLVNKFINTPAQVSQNAMESFVPGGSDDPRLFNEAYGRIVIIGPALPAGKKVGGHARAKAEVFRGALRPFATTVNQELSDVLKSNVRMFVVLPGTVDGRDPSDENLVNTINYLMTKEAGSSSEVIFCPDESR
jgi:NAD(P)-dependent dehydrogenase (short-subunit alcohol dehydrogenase family)